MQDFVFFLGRFHVLALHLPIGIVIAALAVDWVSRRERHAALARAAPFLWGAAALSAMVTAVLGYLHFAEGGFVGPSASAHRLWGTVTAVAAVGAWWLAARWPGRASVARLAAGVATLALVSVTGHYGGHLTHGTTYLTEYAPSFLGGDGRARPTSVAAADPYLDVVQPLLEQRCGTCHNDQKLNGGFSVATYDSTLVGGDTGLAVVPGDLTASELFYRITLPPEDEAFMPAEGKTPPTDSQVEILRWWIEAGAPRETTVAALGVGADVEALLAAELGLGPARTAAEGPAPPSSVDPALVQRLFDAGFLARAVSQDDARLAVSVNSPGTPLPAESFAALASAASMIVDLNLAGTDLDDDELASLGPLAEVTHLRLARNRLSDRSAAALAAFPRIAHLNLYGNAEITDAGLEALASAESLRELYLWQTGVTAAGAARLRERRPGVTVDLGSDAFATPTAAR
jgi:uncharacterized membrane protein